MKRSSYNTLLYGMIQLVSVIFFFTLTPGYAQSVRHTATPELRLKVEARRLTGSNRTIQLTITNTSTAVADLAKCRLVALEKDGKPVRIYYRNIAGRIDELAYPESVPLTELIDTETLNVPRASQTCTIFLAPNGCSASELILFVRDEKEKMLGGPVSVTWGRRKSLLSSVLDASFDVTNLAMNSLSIVILYKLCSILYQPGDSSDTSPASNTPSEQPKLLTPQEIKTYLDKYVVGQESAKIQLASVGHDHMRRIQTPAESQEQLAKHNVLMIGPTGTGKTLLVEKLSQILKVPFYKADANSLTAAGYVGEDVDQMINGLVAAARNNVAAAERGIIFIDEIDKISSDNNSFSSDIGGKKVQDALLTLLQGTEITVEKHKMLPGLGGSTRLSIKNILFICAGAFEGMRNPGGESTLSNTTAFLKAYGMTPELLGRLPCIIRLDPLDVKTLSKILTELEDSPINQWIARFKNSGITLTFTEGAIQQIIKEARESGLGARGLEAVLVQYMNPIRYQSSLLPQSEKKDMLVNEDFLRAQTTNGHLENLEERRNGSHSKSNAGD